MAPRIVSALVVLLLPLALSGAPVQGGAIPVPLPLFPSNNWWNLDVSNAPVDPGSNGYISFIGSATGLHPDFGGDAGGGEIYGFPYLIVDGSQPKLAVTFTEFGDESDGVDPDTLISFPFYPIPSEAITTGGWIEGGPPGNVAFAGDRHMLIVDRTNNTLYELYHVFHDGTGWEAGSGAFFDMNTNGRRPEGWTSADAAGLAILPGLVRYDEVFGADEIRHALRVTLDFTNGHVFPASHTAGSTQNALPMGARLRLKASKDLSGYAPEVQKIFRAMKTYGLIVADNGSDLYISGVYDTRWNNDVLNPAFSSLKASDFEVVQLGWHPPVTFVFTLPEVMGSGDAVTATLTAYDANYNVATGYTGTVQFTSSDGLATLPANYTFTPGDAGTHAFSVTLRTAGTQTVTVSDLADATVRLTRGIAVGPATPAGLAASATGGAQITLTWGTVAGATGYEVVRSSTGSAFGDPIAAGSANYVDNTVAPGAAYLYKVRAVDAAGRRSPYGAADVATAMLFTDDPLTPAATTVKAVHVTQLRQAVNAVRTTAGLGGASFSDPSPAGSLIRLVHVQELRDALAAARSALGLPPLTFTDPVLTGATVKAAHVEELRAGVR